MYILKAMNLPKGFTIEALINFMHKRLCARADDPIRWIFANLD